MAGQGREPCPYRILDDVGGAFAMGSVGGSIFHSIRGARHSPKGERLVGALHAAKARAPVLGGNFAVWGGLYSIFDCSLAAVRRKEDPWNSIIAGGATGGVLAGRAGPKAVGKNALIGGVLLALIEGLGILVTRMAAPPMPSAEDYAAAGVVDPTAPPTDPTAPPLSAGGGAPASTSPEAAELDPLQQMMTFREDAQEGSPYSSSPSSSSSSSDSLDPYSSSSSSSSFDFPSSDSAFGAPEVPEEPPKKKGWFW